MSVTSIAVELVSYQPQGTNSNRSFGGNTVVPVNSKTWLTLTRHSGDVELDQLGLARENRIFEGGFLITHEDGSVATVMGAGWKGDRYDGSEGYGQDFLGQPKPPATPAYTMDSSDACEVGSARAWLDSQGTNVQVRPTKAGKFTVVGVDIKGGMQSKPVAFTVA